MNNDSNVTRLDIPARFDRAPRHTAIAASPLDRVADFIAEPRFLCGFAGGCFFTVAAAWVWSFFL